MAAQPLSEPLVTPDGRYIIVRGRLWRCANPQLPEAERQAHVDALMLARREVRTALRMNDAQLLAAARARVHAAKIALGERGPVWWRDGAADENRRLARNSSYAGWFATLAPDTAASRHPGDAPTPPVQP